MNVTVANNEKHCAQTIFKALFLLLDFYKYAAFECEENIDISNLVRQHSTDVVNYIQCPGDETKFISPVTCELLYYYYE